VLGLVLGFLGLRLVLVLVIVLVQVLRVTVSLLWDT
jgi:hypothetical protein